MSKIAVAPPAGARIEMISVGWLWVSFLVAPLAGARIEIPLGLSPRNPEESLPLRERGLKSEWERKAHRQDRVAPPDETWID